MTSFADLGLRTELVAALATEGINQPFAIQEATIRDSLAGRDVCGRAKTGSGKTLAFGLPMLQRIPADVKPGRPASLVLVPTRELARQVVDVLVPLARAIDLRTMAVYGGTQLDRQMRSLRRPVHLVVATPGRLIDLVDRDAMSLADVQTVAIDEADRMADMGFFPQVEWILRRLENRSQTLLFSATLDGDVGGLVRHYLQDPVRHEVASATQTVDEMHHRFLAVHEMDRVKVAAAVTRGVSRTLIFTRTKRQADRVVTQLRGEDIRAAAIHGDLRQSAREKALADFAEGKVPVLVATDVAGRGIHVEEVDVVLHYEPPQDQKAYLHRSGRTARAGRTGMVVTFVLWNHVADVERLQKRLGLDEPVTEVFSNDARLADLHSLDSPAPSRRAASG
ncbi:MAG: helicase, superfamily [Acidimicrobiales bacterium]|nr:helicase, superfamily [Acidimicrobiales bacterium]